MLHSTTLRLIDQIESGYGQHRAETDRIHAELRAKSIEAHPSHVAARLGQSVEEYAATVKANRDRVIELRESLADPCPVIDLAEWRGGRRV